MISITQKPSWFIELFQRISWSIQAFQANRFGTMLQLQNGVMLDLDKRKIIIPSDFHLHAEGNLTLSSDRHVMIKSGRGDEERPGYIHGIWFNSDEDQYGRPVLDEIHELIEGTDYHGCS